MTNFNQYKTISPKKGQQLPQIQGQQPPGSTAMVGESSVPLVTSGTEDDKQALLVSKKYKTSHARYNSIDEGTAATQVGRGHQSHYQGFMPFSTLDNNMDNKSSSKKMMNQRIQNNILQDQNVSSTRHQLTNHTL